jgi:hypothetical protein
MEDHLAKAGRLATEDLRVKGSSFDASTDRKTSLLRDRSAKACGQARHIGYGCRTQLITAYNLRIDLLFTMSDNLHRAIEDRRDTNSDAWTSACSAGPSRSEGWLANRSGPCREGWWSQTGSNRRPPACKAGALPTELWPRCFSWLANRSSPISAQPSPFGLRRAIFAHSASEDWWAWEDSNFRPHAYQARALTN